MHLQIENNLIHRPDEEFPFKDGIGSIVFNKMQEGFGKKAQIDVLTGEIDTYDSFFRRCVRTAVVMQKKGIKAGDVITVCSFNHLNTGVPIIASYFLGVKPANSNTKFSASDTVHLLKSVNPKMVFVSIDAVNLIEEVVLQLSYVPEIVVFGQTNKHTPFSDFLVESPDEEAQFRPVQVKDLKQTAEIAMSSGSTGLPKGICLGHLAMLNSVRLLSKSREWTIYSTSPSSWNTFAIVLISTITTNSCRLVVSSFDIESFWKTLETYKVDQALMTPMQVALLLQKPSPTTYDLSNLKVFTFGGAALSEKLIVKIRSYLPNAFVYNSYGLTELAISGIWFDLFDRAELQLALKKPTSCGRPMLGFTYKVVDQVTGQALGPNQQGELLIKTDYQMNGYYNMDASGEWDSDGFVKTGDLAYYDEDCCFYITDRIREIFKYQSYHVSPRIIEMALKDHPALKDAVIIGIPHEIDSERPVALVELKKEYVEKVSEAEIQDFVAGKVNDMHKLRGGVIFVKSLLITPSGKYRRRQMRELVLNDRIKELQ